MVKSPYLPAITPGVVLLTVAEDAEELTTLVTVRALLLASLSLLRTLPDALTVSTL